MYILASIFSLKIKKTITIIKAILSPDSKGDKRKFKLKPLCENKNTKKVTKMTVRIINRGIKNNKPPIIAEIPVPPLNLWKRGKSCPITAKDPIKAGKTPVKPIKDAKRGGKKPFKESKLKTNAPANSLTFRKTLVAPGFSSPSSLISLFEKMLVNIMAGFMEPRR